jgi:hypothetical protein
MKMKMSTPTELYKSLASSVRRSCTRNKSLVSGLNHYGLSLEDANIVFETIDEEGNPKFNRLQKGKESRASVIVSMSKTRLEPTALYIELGLLEEKDKAAVTPQ